jgi:hypothetical protein
VSLNNETESNLLAGRMRTFTLGVLVCGLLAAEATATIPSDPRSVARLVGDAFFKSSAPPKKGALGVYVDSS